MKSQKFFHLINAIRIQHFRLNTIRIQYRSGSRALMTKNWKKNYSWICFLTKTIIYLSLGLHKERPNYISLQLSTENIQHLRIRNTADITQKEPNGLKYNWPWFMFAISPSLWRMYWSCRHGHQWSRLMESAIRLNAVLEAAIAHLATGLANRNSNASSHFQS